MTSYNFTLREILADSANSPRDTALSITVSAAPTENILVVLIYGDSRVGGVQSRNTGVDAVRADLIQGVTDFGVTGTPDAGYGTSHGITQVGLTTQLPWQMYMNTMTTVDHLSPFEYACRYLLDQGYYTKVVCLGAGWGSSHFIDNGAELTVYAKAKAAWGLALVQAAYPGASITTAIDIEFGVNDMTTASDPAALATALYSATTGWAADIRTVSGWGSAPITGVAVGPEEATFLGSYALGDTAMKIALLKDVASAYWAVYPTGIAGLHEGDLSGTTEQKRQMVRDAGYLHIGPVMAVALGKASATAPTITITDNYNVTELASTQLSLGSDQPAYFTVNANSTLKVANTGDLAAISQSVGPYGGAWPAYTGTSADTINYTENYITGKRYTGSVSRNVIVNQIVSETFLAYDNFNRANAGPSSGALGTTSGDPVSSTGGGLTWKGNGGTAQIVSNQAALPWDSGSGTYVTRGVDVGTKQQIVKARIIVASGYAAWLVAGGNDPSGANPLYGIRFNSGGGSSGNFLWNGPFGERYFAWFSALAAGTYDIEIRLDTAADMAGLWIDGVNTVPMTKTELNDDLAGVGTYASIAMEYIGAAHRWEDFKVKALP